MTKYLEYLSHSSRFICKIGHLFEIALLDTAAFHFDKSNVSIHEGEQLTYINGTSREKFTVPDIEIDILLGNDTDGGFIDVDYSVRVEASREIVGNWLEDSTILESTLNIGNIIMCNGENSCKTILDNY